MKTYKLYLILTEEDDETGTAEDFDPVMVEEFDTEQEARLFRAALYEAANDIVPPEDWGYENK